MAIDLDIRPFDYAAQIRIILHELADRLHPAMPNDHLIQPHRRIEDRSARQMAVECRRAASLSGAAPLKEHAAFLLMASRTLNDMNLNVHLLDYQARLEGLYGLFDPLDLKSDTDDFDSGRAELLFQLQAAQG